MNFLTALFASLWGFGLRVLMDGVSIPELQGRLVELNNLATAIQARADKEARPLTMEEAKEIDTIFATFAATEADIARRTRMMDQAAKLATPQPQNVPQPQPGQRVTPQNPGFETGTPGNSIVAVEKPGQWGWNHFGDFASAVRAACRPGSAHVDNRLAIRNAPSTYGTEGVGEEGGFLVPPDFRTAIMQKVQAEDALLARTDQLVSSSNQIVVPTDETTPWDSSAGVLAYWEGEAANLPASKVKLQDQMVRLNKLTALVNVTSELIEDAPALDGYLRRKAPTKINFKINRAIVAGTGAGQPLGILSSPALVTVAKESNQAAATLAVANIVKMWARLYSGCWATSVWLCNQDVLPQLMTLNTVSVDVTGATVVGSQPVFIPPGGLSASPFGTLLGRPIVFTEACETLGTVGDILLVDLNSYMSALKVGGLRSDVSMHLYFDYDMMTYRFILRVAGNPWWSAPITPRSGSSNTLSCFVALATR